MTLRSVAIGALAALTTCVPLLVNTTASAAAADSRSASSAAAQPTQAAEQASGPVIVSPQNGARLPARAGSWSVQVDMTGAEPGTYPLTLTCQAPWADDAETWTINVVREPGSSEDQVYWTNQTVRYGSACVVEIGTDRREFSIEWGPEAIESLGLSSYEVWPASSDGPIGTTLSFKVLVPGTYEISVKTGRRYVLDVALGHLDPRPEPYTFTWDGETNSGDRPLQRRHTINVIGVRDQGPDGDDRIRETLDVWYSTETATMRDKTGERGTGQAMDVSTFEFSNGPEGIASVFTFRRVDVSARYWQLTTGIDVDKSKKGYLVSVSPGKNFKLNVTVALAYLNSDVGRPIYIKCPGADVALRDKQMTVSVPRTCLPRGGNRASANWFGGAQPAPTTYVYDGPDNPYRQWTKTVTYRVPPRG